LNANLPTAELILRDRVAVFGNKTWQQADDGGVPALSYIGFLGY
jgi:hypothetical protein